MTRVYFVRHAQSDKTWEDDRTRPLTRIGLEDRKKVTDLLVSIPIDYFYSSPYKRSMDTIAECADILGKPIYTDERFRERQKGINGYHIDLVKKRWEDFDFCEEEGESLRSVQKRNIEALNEILTKHKDKTIVIGTHGTALSTILNYYDPGFSFEGFNRIWYWMPYVIRLDFEGTRLVGKEELLFVERGY
uniref:PGAM, 2,3-bisphosphoglycerate-dependent phosphoglycerate mutase n=1 Tax=uncultured firmicutes bacterium contig_31 TaxID=1643554 RepID=A0A141GNF0_9FIRM|nr:PGAM, 2,3-bisphosphoglycerate-dependent phosphoglycerate mutase [uncultured firmicutes bacterium contig_31]